MDARHPLAVVTPTLDGDVLAALAQTTASFTTGQLRRVLPEFSEDGIRRVLRRLVRQGIVSSEPAGRAYLYGLNRDHIAAGPIIELARARATLLGRIEGELGGWDPLPVYGAVFGSMAQGSARTDSDVDLLIVGADDFVDGAWDEQVSQLAGRITRWTGNDARPITMTESELVARRNEPLVDELRAHGLTVYGTKAWFLQRVLGR